MIILIPAYEPDVALTDLVGALTISAPGIPIVVVDDGSGPRHAAVFDDVAALGATVLGHVRNQGKGAALRTGFRHAMSAFPGHSVVTADADGQHTVADILNVGATTVAAVDSGAPVMVLGCRDTGRRGNPMRSRLGSINSVNTRLHAMPPTITAPSPR